MKFIDIFLASSIIDMKDDRMEIGNYIRALNDRFVESGLYFRLHMCEDLSDEIAKTRKQDEYNDLIKKCDYFYVMAWRTIGEYTIEEFEVARKAYNNNSHPRISTFFKKDGSKADKFVRRFMDELGSKFGHYYTVFSSIDSIKLKILLQMTDNGEITPQLEFKNSKLWVDGKTLSDVHLDQIPFYYFNKGLASYKKEIKALEEEIALVQERDAVGGSGQSSHERDELLERRNNLLDEMHKIEMKLLQTSTRFIKLESNGKFVTPRAKLAMELFEKGDLDDAIKILNDDDRKSEYQRTCEEEKVVDDKLNALLNEVIVKIDCYKNYSMTKENVEIITEYYEEAREMIRRHDLDPTAIIEFMWFLRDQKNYEYAKEVGRKMHASFESKDKDKIDPALWARFCNDYGVLCRDEEETDKARDLLMEAYEIRRNLAATDNEKHAYDFAITCNSLGIFYRMKDKMDRAAEYYEEGIEIMRSLSDKNILIYGGQRANICNNLGYLYLRTKVYDKAEALFWEAYDVRTALEAKQPGAHIIYLGRIHNNLGELFGAMNKMEKAEEHMLKGLELREESAKNNPVEKVYAAGSKLSLAVLYCGMGRYAEAERMFLDALTVYEKYVKKNSKAYTAKFADAKSGLGDLYRRMGRLSDGERELTRAVEIYRQLLDDTHGEHAPEFARVCIEAGVLFGEMGRHSEAAEFFDEARDLLRSAVRSNNDLYCGIAACAAYNYAVALVNGGDPEGAEDELASFRRKLRKDAEFDKESAFILERIEAAFPELPKKYEVPVIARLYSM